MNSPVMNLFSEPLVVLTHTQYMQLLKTRDDYESSINYMNKGINDAANSVELALNEVPQVQTPIEQLDEPTHTYEGNNYRFVTEAKIKVRGIIEKFMAHPEIGTALRSVPHEVLETASQRWLDVVIYEALYQPYEGMYFVRMKEEFYAKLQPIVK